MTLFLINHFQPMRAANIVFTWYSIPKARQNHSLPAISARNGQLRICSILFIPRTYNSRTGVLPKPYHRTLQLFKRCNVTERREEKTCLSIIGTPDTNTRLVQSPQYFPTKEQHTVYSNIIIGTRIGPMMFQVVIQHLKMVEN